MMVRIDIYCVKVCKYEIFLRLWKLGRKVTVVFLDFNNRCKITKLCNFIS